MAERLLQPLQNSEKNNEIKFKQVIHVTLKGNEGNKEKIKVKSVCVVQPCVVELSRQPYNSDSHPTIEEEEEEEIDLR
jgi:hypothetical protein